MVKAIDTAAFRAALEAKKTLVVDFWAEWCGPCRMLAPVMEELSEAPDLGAEFVKIDVDDNPDLAREYSIMSIPCVMVFKNGAPVAKNVGFAPKKAMEEFIRRISDWKTGASARRGPRRALALPYIGHPMAPSFSRAHERPRGGRSIFVRGGLRRAAGHFAVCSGGGGLPVFGCAAAGYFAVCGGAACSRGRHQRKAEGSEISRAIFSTGKYSSAPKGVCGAPAAPRRARASSSERTG